MKRLTVNQSVKIALHNRDMTIVDLEAENLALRIERERLKEMVARYADIGACLDTDQNGKLMSLTQGGPLAADATD